MPNYQEMYHRLFKEMNNTIENLKQAMCETEEIFMSEPKAKSSKLLYLKTKDPRDNDKIE